MTFRQELSSWLSFGSVDTATLPSIGSAAPSSDVLACPRPSHRPSIIVFLRHCGCPFAEKAFKTLRQVAIAQPNIECIAVSHSDQKSTDDWLDAIGGARPIKVIVDYHRILYAAWGLGSSSFWHVLNPWSMGSVMTLGKQDGIWNRPTQSGSRWQTSGWWAIDGAGIVKWGGPAKAADEIGDWNAALRALDQV